MMRHPDQMNATMHRLHGRVSGALAALLTVALAGWTGCGPDDGTRFHLADDVVRPPRGIVVIAPDGMDYQKFCELLEKGDLPNIERVFVKGGVHVEHAFDCLPTVTYANFASLITGRFPAHHGITGNLWLDRDTFKCGYYMTLGTYRDVNDHLQAPTVYEMLGDHFTANIQCHTRRGATVTLDNSERFKWSWIVGAYLEADRNVPNSLPALERIANRVKRWPSLIVTYYPGVDEIGHRYGTDSVQYVDALRNIDVVVGRITRSITEEGLDDRTSFVLVSDHGMVPVERHFDMKQWLHRVRGLRVKDRPLTARKYPDRLDAIDRYDAFLVVGSDRWALLHLKGNRGWPYAPAPEEIDTFVTRAPALYEQPGVDCVVMHAGRDRVRVRARRGAALIERQWVSGANRYRLRIEEGDPLGYLEDPALVRFVDAGWHDSRAWLEATARTDRPDFVPQAVELFDSSRTGDLLIFAVEGWDFVGQWKAGHGSCVHRDMRIPLFFAGPDLPAGVSIPYGRLVDVTPTILGLLGEADRLERFASIDGIDLSGQLRAAGQVSAEPAVVR